MAYTRPLPQPDAQTRGFWDGCRAGELRVLRCEDCGTWIHEPAPICHACQSERLDWRPVSGQGQVYSWTVVHHAPGPGFQDEVPYTVAWIELDEQPGLRILSNVVDHPPEQVHAGMRVRVAFREATEDVRLPVFRPA